MSREKARVVVDKLLSLINKEVGLKGLSWDSTAYVDDDDPRYVIIHLGKIDDGSRSPRNFGKLSRSNASFHRVIGYAEKYGDVSGMGHDPSGAEGPIEIYSLKLDESVQRNPPSLRHQERRQKLLDRENEIERRVERMTDRLDERYMDGKISETVYRDELRKIDDWAKEQYDAI